ncbi:MAG: hypothetical protein E6J90_29880 [Deltaproteobacteria bacterium]|nr:MAG: hypothetical protein E6J90_29880 [Deltaproteobacteria bacterium]
MDRFTVASWVGGRTRVTTARYPVTTGVTGVTRNDMCVRIGHISVVVCVVTSPIRHGAACVRSQRRHEDLADRRAMTRDQIFDALSALSATQLDAVVYKLAVPRAILPGPSTPPVTVIVEALHWAEQQGRLDDVARLLAEVSAPAPATLAPDAGSASSLRQAVDELDTLLREHRRAVHRPPDVVKQAKDRIERLAEQIAASWIVGRGSVVAGAMLERRIGAGNFGTVWYAVDRATGEPRAVKVFHIDKLTVGLMLGRFRRSIRALKRLSERPRLRKRSDDRGSVVTFYEEDESTLAFSMKYLPGGSLDDAAKLGWSLDAKVVAMVKICAAVAYGHENGIVHRDIKPANIVLSERHEPVLTDFDIADIKFVTSLSTVAEGGLGTPVFAAPEQLRDGEASDERSDVYSLGRVLHFLLIEQSPGIELGKEPELRNLRDFPPGIVEVVRRATQHLPSRRFVNVTQMLEALEHSRTGAAARAARLGDMRRWIVRNIRLLLTMLAITGSAVGFGLYERSRAHREQILRDQARTEEALTRAAVGALAEAAKELARLNQQVRNFQASTTTLVSRKDALVASIAELKRAVNDTKTSTKDREGFQERLVKGQEDLDRVNAQITENQAQQRQLQDEIVAAEARVKRQASAGRPPAQESGPAQESSPVPAQEPPSKCEQCKRKHDHCLAMADDAWFYCVADVDGLRRSTRSCARPGCKTYNCDELDQDLVACDRKLEACRRDSCQ